MKNMKTITFILCLLTTYPAISSAAWVDDWIQQRTTTSPGYFQGQQRGYYSAGGFSARWPSTADYPVTVEPPRIKGGCGGIDVFMGGYSFMNSDYLVNKLQGILSGAAAVAFDLGLKTLCEQCSNTIKNFEALSDKLNSMQVDECAAAKEMVGVVMDEDGFHSSEVMKEKMGTAIKENKLRQGTSEMWDIITQDDWSNNNVPNSSDVQKVTSGCNADIRNTFLNSGSLLDNIGSKMSIPTDHIKLIRGLTGDVRLEGPANAYRISYEAPCAQNNPDDIKSFAYGDVYAKDSGGTCSQIPDTNRDLVTFVSNTLTGIAQKIETKGALTTAETDFLNQNPLSAMLILKTAVSSRTKQSVIAGLADITAKAYSVQMLSDLYIRAEMIARKAKEMLEKQASAATGTPPENCNPAIFAEKADQNISIMINRIRQLQDAARSSYVASAKEMTTIMDYVHKMQQIENRVFADLTNRYGKEIVMRIQ